MSLINKEVAPFEAKAFYKNTFQSFSKMDLLGKWSIFFFYPADFTVVCPTELVDLQKYYDKFQAINCEVFSISTDSQYVHKAWHDSSDNIGAITFPMLSDSTHRLSQAFEILNEEAGYAERGTFIINPDAKIVAYEVNSTNVGRNAEELLRKVKALQFVHNHTDLICPAGWQPASETVKPSLNLTELI